MKAILILGAAMWSTGPSPAMTRRVQHALRLWKEEPENWIIPCGGVGKHGRAEAVEMQSILVQENVDPSHIFTEAHSTSTYENIKFALPLVRLLDATAVKIVTDDFHAKRAELVAKQFGLNATVSPVRTTGMPMPSKAKAHFREGLARQVYRARLLRSRIADRDLL